MTSAAHLARLTQPTGGADAPLMFQLVPGEAGIWVLSGEVDFGCAAAFASALGATGGTPWIVDVSGLDFVDVAGMRAIAVTATGAGIALELRHASPQLRRLWAIAGFDRSASQVRLVP